MRINQIYFIAALILTVIVLAVFQYIFSIYEVDIRIDPDILYADNRSECVIRAVPLNSFGMEIPFRNSAAKIELKEGTDLVEVIELNQETGIIRLRAKYKPGIVLINIKPEKALLPTLIEIKIEPNVT